MQVDEKDCKSSDCSPVPTASWFTQFKQQPDSNDLTINKPTTKKKATKASKPKNRTKPVKSNCSSVSSKQSQRLYRQDTASIQPDPELLQVNFTDTLLDWQYAKHHDVCECYEFFDRLDVQQLEILKEPGKQWRKKDLDYMKNLASMLHQFMTTKKFCSTLSKYA